MTTTSTLLNVVNEMNFCLGFQTFSPLLEQWTLEFTVKTKKHYFEEISQTAKQIHLGKFFKVEVLSSFYY